MPSDHDVPGDAPSVPPPLTDAQPSRRRTPAEEARTLLAATNVGALATLTAGGDPWGSIVTYGLLGNGAPVLCVSRLAEHGRNLDGDPRASLVVSAPVDETYPLAGGRVTVAGRARRPRDGDETAAARAAHLAGVPSAELYVDFGDFALWLLEVQRVRWVGGYGRMASADAGAYAAAEADPSPAPRPAPSRTSTPTTPARCWRWRTRSPATPTPPPRPAPPPTATASTSCSRPRAAAPRRASPTPSR
jgi:hypothetical protein